MTLVNDNIHFDDIKDAEITKLLIEKKRPGCQVRIKPIKPGSKVFYLTVNSKDMTKDLLEKSIGIKLKDLNTCLGL